MAVTLQVTDGTTTINLANTTGPQLEAGYLPVFPSPSGDGTIPPDITEALPVIVRIATDDGLAATMQDIARLSEQAALYTAGAHQTPVWYHRKLENETGTIRFLVKSLQFAPNAQFGGFFDDGPHITDGRLGTLTITHHPYGEATTAVAASGTDDASVLGGAVNYTDVAGDVPARLYYIHIDDLPGAVVYRQFWMGFRSDARAAGDASKVISLWELENGTANAANDTAITTDATASPGGAGNTKMRCTFAVNTDWGGGNRCVVVMSDVVAVDVSECAYQVGAFVVLLRAKVDAGTAQVYLRSGPNTDVVYRQGPVVDISATSWTLYNLGTVEFPTRDLHAVPTALFAATYDQRDSMAIWARVKPGATAPSALDMDCLVLIPCDEYFLHVESAEASQASPDDVYVLASPEDVAQSVTIDVGSSWLQSTNPTEAIGAGIPHGDGRLFIAVATANSGTAPTYSDDVDVELSTYPRWVYFRGTE